MKLLLIGDSHCDVRKLRQLPSHDLAVHLGDLGLADTYKKILKRPNARTFRVLGGNHDEYPALVQYPHYLGDYGWVPGLEEQVGFVRGAASPDKLTRFKDQNWWAEEELKYEELNEFLNWYEQSKPRIMLSHTAPKCVARRLIPPGFSLFKTGTEEALDQALGLHAPEAWYFGHFHVNHTLTHEGCKFTCINKQDWLVLDL